MDNLHIPGSPKITTAAAGERGTVVIATTADPVPIVMRAGKPYRGEVSLEPLIGLVLKAARSIADAMRGPLAGKPMVHGVLVAPGASVPFTHLDVLVTSPADLAMALSSYPVVRGPEQVGLALSVLLGMAGDTVPRSFPERVSRERSADEIASIKARPAPPRIPQPWREWSPDSSHRALKGTWDDRYGYDTSKPSPRVGLAGKRARRSRPAQQQRHRARHPLLRALALPLAVVAVVAALMHFIDHRVLHEPRALGRRPGSHATYLAGPQRHSSADPSEALTSQLDVVTEGFNEKDAFNEINYGLIVRNRSIALTAIDVSVTVTFSSRSGAQVATDEETVTEVPPGGSFDVGGSAFSNISLAPAHMRVSLKVAGNTFQKMPLPTATARIQNVPPFTQLAGEVHNPYEVPLPSDAMIYVVYLNQRGKVLGGDNETTGASVSPGTTVPFTDQPLSAISSLAAVRVSVDPDGFPTPGSGLVRWVPA